MTSMIIGFGFLALAFVLSVYKFWQVQRRARMREREMTTRMMEQLWGRNTVSAETSETGAEVAESE